MTTIHVAGQPMRVISEIPVRYPMPETDEQRKARVAKGLAEPMYGFVAVRVEDVER